MIIPAILPKDYQDLHDKLELINGSCRLVQVDICDGSYTSRTTWPYKKDDDHFEAILREEEGMPFWEDFDFEIDLMVSEPEKYFEHWIVAGASMIIFHAKDFSNFDQFISKIPGLVEVGIAIERDTNIESIDKIIDKVNFFQVMGVREVGAQGLPFDPNCLEQIKLIKNKYPNIRVQVDGGVNFDTLLDLKDAGVESFVVGSAIFGSDVPSLAVKDFKKLAH